VPLSTATPQRIVGKGRETLATLNTRGASNGMTCGASRLKDINGLLKLVTRLIGAAEN
jgi:hypothetical protein